MTLEPNVPKFSGLNRRLVDEGSLTAQQMQEAIDGAKKNKKKLIPYLIDHSNINSSIIAALIAQEFGEPYLNLDAFNADLLPKEITDVNLVNKYQVLPLYQRGQTLYVATSDPTDLEALDAIKFNTKLNVSPVIVEANKLQKLIEKKHLLRYNI